jgi:hypothetical protein
LNRFLKQFKILFEIISNVKSLINVIYKSKNNFITYVFRPTYLNYNLKDEGLIHIEVNQYNEPYEQGDIISIVMQGPIIKKNNFTYETLKLYKSNFPNSIVIFSTWEGINSSDANIIRDLGVDLILNKYPKAFGPGNINLQIVSTSVAIKQAKDLGAKYVLKCRSDQRIYNKNIFKYLLSLLDQFPVKFDSNFIQKKRIIGASMNTFKYRMYGMTDMLNFGQIDDMLNYWDANLDTRENIKEEITKSHIHPYDFAKYNVCEVYLTTLFLKKNGVDINWTLDDSLEKYAKHFCIINQETLDLYWGKYTSLEYRWKEYGNETNYFEELTFNDWLLLYQKYNKQENI